MSRILSIAAVTALAVTAAVVPAQAQQVGKTVHRATAGGVASVGSNNGNGNGDAVSNGGSGRAPLVSVGSNNGNGNGYQIDNGGKGGGGGGGSTGRSAVSVGSNNGNGNGYQVKNGCAVASDAGSGMLGSTPGC